ncbi:transposase [Candidatus Bathyarchaeota archaeon]|nr:transposase [Candidatus Bathyarchaeota archaeon]
MIELPSTAQPSRLGRGELIGYDGYRRIKGTKMHAAVSHEALPLSVQVGDEHDSNRLTPLPKDIRVKRGKGRPLSRPKEVIGDSAYDTKEVRAWKRRGIKANIEVNPRNRRKLKRGRPYRLDRETYKRMRSAVERFFAWLTAFRRAIIRYERLAAMFKAAITFACIIIHMRYSL